MTSGASLGMLYSFWTSSVVLILHGQLSLVDSDARLLPDAASDMLGQIDGRAEEVDREVEPALYPLDDPLREGGSDDGKVGV